MPSESDNSENRPSTQPPAPGNRRHATKGQRRGQPKPKVPGEPNARWKPPTGQSNRNDKNG